jgi:chromosome segregation ATPase
MNEPTTITYSIAEVLKRIEDKLESNQKETNEKFKELNNKVETIQKDVTDLKVGQATITEKVAGMDKRLEKVENEQAVMVKAISDLQGFRSLILPIIVGGISAVIENNWV